MSLAFSHELGRRAQEQRSQAIGGLIAATGRVLLEQVKKVFDTWRRARIARATYQALSELDDWTLRDLGMDRSELESVAREVSAQMDFTRVRSAHLKSMIV